MLNVCWQCGAYRPDKVIDPTGPFAVCPECGHAHAFQQRPLLIVSGASGAGKSTVCQALLGQLPSVVLLDSDILWSAAFAAADDHNRGFFETWLRMCKNIAQSGRSVVLFGAGFGMPANLEPCVERRYFSTIAYLALVCDGDALAERLQRRPAWRGSGAPDYLANHLRFNQWFQAYADEPPITLIDTTHAPVAATTQAVTGWITHMLTRNA